MFSYAVLRAVASVTVSRTVYVPAVVYACVAWLLAEGAGRGGVAPVPGVRRDVAVGVGGEAREVMVWLMRGWDGSANHDAFVGGAPEVAIARQP